VTVKQSDTNSATFAALLERIEKIIHFSYPLQESGTCPFFAEGVFLFIGLQALDAERPEEQK
jgi:hypothetical protein